MSECIYSVWIRRFLIMNNLRRNTSLCMNTIIGCTILKNMCREWQEPNPDSDGDEGNEEGEEGERGEACEEVEQVEKVELNTVAAGSTRPRGNNARKSMMYDMDP